MGNSRSLTTKFNANRDALERALKANGITKTRRRKFIEWAASGRPADLAAQARQSLSDRRVQRDINMIAGR